MLGQAGLESIRYIHLRFTTIFDLFSLFRIILVEKRLGQMSAVSMPFANENHQTMLTNKSGFNKKEIGVKE